MRILNLISIFGLFFFGCAEETVDISKSKKILNRLDETEVLDRILTSEINDQYEWMVPDSSYPVRWCNVIVDFYAYIDSPGLLIRPRGPLFALKAKDSETIFLAMYEDITRPDTVWIRTDTLHLRLVERW